MSEEERNPIDLHRWAEDHLEAIERRREALIAAIPLDTFVEHRLALVPSSNGDHLIAPCPFHGDDRPSLYVVPSKGFYHCFACGAHGDVVGFDANDRGIDEWMSMMQLEKRVAAGENPIRVQPTPTAEEQSALREELGIFKGNK
jgi:DNA primase